MATLEGRGFRGVDLSLSLMFSLVFKLILLFGRVGGGPLPARKDRRFSEMVLRAVVCCGRCNKWEGRERKKKEKHNINAVKNKH